MFFHQRFVPGLAVLSYMVGDEKAKEVAVIGRLETIDVKTLANRLQDRDAKPFVLDVRTETEWNDGHIDGAHHIHGGLLKEKFSEVPKDRPVAVICGTGYRGSIASSFLKREGYAEVANVLGGMTAWKNAGQSTVKDRAEE